MSSFWASKVAPQQAAPPAVPAAPSGPWWQQSQAPQRVDFVAQQPAALPTLPTPQQGSVDPQAESDFGSLLRQDGYTTTKAQSAKDTERCPSCGSNNYVRASGHPNSMKQCFECGHNPRFEQMAAGTTGIPTKGPVRAARVQNTPVAGAPPMGAIIQHI